MKNKVPILLLKSLWRKPATRIFVSLCILVILINSVPFTDLWKTITEISPVLWVSILFAFLFGHLLGVVKWSLLINIGSNRLPFALACQCYFAGLFSNLFLPSLAGGDVVRAGLAIQHNLNKETAIVGGLLDRFLDTGALGLIILASVLYSPTSLSIKGVSVLGPLLLAGFICILLLLLVLVLPMNRILPKQVGDFIERIKHIIVELLRNPKRGMSALIISLFIQSGFILLNAVFGRACDIHLPLHIWFLIWPLAKLSAMLPISLGGLGVRETALALILLHFDVPFFRSVGLGLLWESVLVAGGMVGGLFYLYSRNNISITKSSLRSARFKNTVSY